LISTIETQEQLLVYGQVPNSPPPSSVVRRNGMAYLEGWDTWSELSSIVAPDTCTQPVRLGLNEVRFKLNKNINYETEVAPLLDTMATQFTALSSGMPLSLSLSVCVCVCQIGWLILLSLAEYAQYTTSIPANALQLYMDFVDAMNITAQRAVQVDALYQYSWGFLEKPPSWRKKYLNTAASAIVAATEIVAEREQHYRVSVERIASYRPNPTVYAFTYLWTGMTLMLNWHSCACVY
jgi:hypothetical protein